MRTQGFRAYQTRLTVTAIAQFLSYRLQNIESRMFFLEQFIPKILDCPYVQIIRLVMHEHEDRILIFHQYRILFVNSNGLRSLLLSYFQYIHLSRSLVRGGLFAHETMMNLLLLPRIMIFEILRITIYQIQDWFVQEETHLNPQMWRQIL